MFEYINIFFHFTPNFTFYIKITLKLPSPNFVPILKLPCWLNFTLNLGKITFNWHHCHCAMPKGNGQRRGLSLICGAVHRAAFLSTERNAANQSELRGKDRANHSKVGEVPPKNDLKNNGFRIYFVMFS